MVLAVAITLVTAILLIRIDMVRSASWDFHPFRVVVYPKFNELLHNYRLSSSDSELRKLDDILKNANTSFQFTVLKPDPGFVDFRGLIYCNRQKTFLSEVDFSLWMNMELGFPNEIFRVASTSLSMKWGTDGGYDLGLVLDGQLWEQICSEAPHLKNSKIAQEMDMYGSKTITVAIATLPYIEFDEYWDAFPPRSLPKTFEKQKYRDAKVTENGWNRENWDYRCPDTHRLEHKYFTVEHRRI